jgi:DNA-binding Lrp family transcriptional regulator
MLDRIDMEIISHLRTHGRDSFRTVAKKTGVHPTTAIKRIGRMEKEGLITGYSANFSLPKLGYEFMALIDISISRGHLIDAEKRIGSLNGIVAIYDITGEHDAVALVACKNRLEFSKLVKHILAEPYVERTNTHVILNIIRDQSQFVPR